MTVAENLSTGQNAERPGGNRGALRLINCRDEAAENGEPSLAPFSAHLLGRSKRGVLMSPNDNPIGSRSPSGWHDHTISRDAGHDAMQVAVFEYLLAEKPRPWRFSDHKNEFILENIYFEYPFIKNGHVIAWGDIVRVWIEQDGKNDLYTKLFYEVFEIKPVVHSVGAIVRQCIALHLAAREALTSRNGNTPIVKVCPVIPINTERMGSDDKKASQMRHVSQHLWNVDHVYLWTGGSLS
jgi:hypothetical protein